jgi:hypothetical protein
MTRMKEPTPIADLMAAYMASPGGLEKTLGSTPTELGELAEAPSQPGRVAHLATRQELARRMEAYNDGRPLRDQVRGPEFALLGALLLGLQQANQDRALKLGKEGPRRFLVADIEPAGLAGYLHVHIKTVKRNLRTLLQTGIVREFGKGDGYHLRIGILADLIVSYRPARQAQATAPALGAGA